MSWSRQRLGAFAVLAFAVLFAVSVAVIPRVDSLTDEVEMASVAGGGTARWAWGYVLAILAVGLGVVAALAVRAWLRDAARDSTAGRAAVPLLAVGGVLLAAALGVNRVALAIVIESGGAGTQYLTDGRPWTAGLFLAGGFGFVAGLLLVALELLRSGMVPRVQGLTVFAALAAYALAQGAPWGWAMWVQAASLLVALPPLAWQMWPRWPSRR